MSYYVSLLIIAYLLVIFAVICAIWLILDKKRRIEDARRKREAERAAEYRAFDKVMRDRIAWERMMNAPVGTHDCGGKPLRKAVGLFSDDEAQKALQADI